MSWIRPDSHRWRRGLSSRRILIPLLVLAFAAIGPVRSNDLSTEIDIPVPMRDGTLLRADLYRPTGEGRFPTLVYRTPYGKHDTVRWYDTHLDAVERGYAVVIQDVRGRHASEGVFYPYIHEGNDGFDTIEWAAAQPWSNGKIGTFGLSYPGAVQWLAAVERPPHLKAMVPAMTFATPQLFVYFNGVFDLSWLPWIHNSIAPDTRVRKGLAGPQTHEEAQEEWSREHQRMRSHLPLLTLPDFKEVAPYYYDWLRHPPTDEWWDWGVLSHQYNRVDAAVLNLSGWYDEAYGPDGATANFNGLMTSRHNQPDPRTQLILGPWVHGVDEVQTSKTGDLDFGPDAAIDYNEIVLRWMDRYVREIDNGVDKEGPVRLFVMGENRWREEATWPPLATRERTLWLESDDSKSRTRGLSTTLPTAASSSSSFLSRPSDPVSDPYGSFGPHDYQDLLTRDDLLVFQTEPLKTDLEVTGAMSAEIFVSCDCTDLDLWVKVLDVAPDGSAFNLMSPGLDVLRASYRDLSKGRQLLEPGKTYLLRLPNLITSNLFRQGHRIRVQISGAFFPHLSRNLQTGELETTSSETWDATITIHHDVDHPSRLLLPTIEEESKPTT